MTYLALFLFLMLFFVTTIEHLAAFLEGLGWACRAAGVWSCTALRAIASGLREGEDHRRRLRAYFGEQEADAAPCSPLKAPERENV